MKDTKPKSVYVPERAEAVRQVERRDRAVSRRWRRLRPACRSTRRAAAVGGDACRAAGRRALDGDRVRVYFSVRDARGSRAHRPRRRSTLPPAPALAPLERRPGARPRARSAPSTTAASRRRAWSTVGARRFLYYTGWTRGVTVPFYLAVGLAVSEDGGTVRARVAGAAARPQRGRSVSDRVAVGADRGRRAGGCGTCPAPSGGHGRSGPRHYYHIRYAESTTASPGGVTAVSPSTTRTDDEYAFARPCVVADADGVSDVVRGSGRALPHRLRGVGRRHRRGRGATTRGARRRRGDGWESRDGRVPVRVRLRTAAATCSTTATGTGRTRCRPGRAGAVGESTEVVQHRGHRDARTNHKRRGGAWLARAARGPDRAEAPIRKRLGAECRLESGPPAESERRP